MFLDKNSVSCDEINYVSDKSNNFAFVKIAAISACLWGNLFFEEFNAVDPRSFGVSSLDQ